MYVTKTPFDGVDVLKTVTTGGVDRTTAPLIPLLDSVTETTTGIENVETGWSVMVLVLVESS